MTWTAIKDTRRRSRKRRQCIICEDWIEVREIYVSREGIDSDEGRDRVAMHEDCESRTRTWKTWEWEDIDTFEMRKLREVNHDLDTPRP